MGDVVDLPRLLHPVQVTIQRANRSTALQDHDLREPVPPLPRTTFIVAAQIGRGKADAPSTDDMGTHQQSDGYLLFLAAEIRAAGYQPAIGDMVTAIGTGDAARTVRYYLTRLEHRGHDQEAGGATLIKAYFEDRSPSAVSP